MTDISALSAQHVSTSTYEHPVDVLSFIYDELTGGRQCALIMVTGTLGGSVRRPGAMMAVNEAGDIAGYVSGGCIDADVALHARQALQTGEASTLRYGTGSPFLDIQLPCGGGIDVTICPNPDQAVVSGALSDLNQRREIALSVSPAGEISLLESGFPQTGFQGDKFIAVCQPRLQLRLAGRGADIIATSRLASGAGFATLVQSPDKDILDAVSCYSGVATQHISAQSYTATTRDDRWTAFLLMFHDTDLETPLLCDALEGDAFFIGAVGSYNAQARRRENLLERGLSDNAIARIHGPVGLVPAMRDASMLAISALSQVVAIYHGTLQ